MYESKEEMFSAAIAMASLIASKSPVAIASTKHNLTYSRDHSVDDGLNYMVSCNVFWPSNNYSIMVMYFLKYLNTTAVSSQGILLYSVITNGYHIG